jgi:hypothetical protein
LDLCFALLLIMPPNIHVCMCLVKADKEKITFQRIWNYQREGMMMNFGFFFLI